MRIPKYRKHSTSDQARVTINGRTHYLGPYGSKESKAKYNRLIGEYVAAGGVPVAKADQLTLSEMLLAYLQYAVKHYGEASSELDDLRRVIKRLRTVYGSTVAENFGYVQFEVIRQGFVDGGLSRCYVNEQMRRLIRIFRWAASRKLISTSVPEALRMIEPLTKGRTTAAEPKKVLPVSGEMVNATLPHLPSVVADMVRLQSLLGCRPGELCRVQPRMIDRSAEVWEIHLEEHKNAHRGKSRTIFVGPKAQVILAPYLLRPDDQCCFRPIDSERYRRRKATEERKTRASCGNRPGSNRKRSPKRRPGERYNSCTYARTILRACDKAFPVPDGLNDADARKWKLSHRWSPNQLRHSLATEVRRSFGLDASRVLLGHSDAATTTIYAEQDRQLAIRVAQAAG